jgi:hypothetical protein
MNGGSVTTNGNENENGSPVKQVMANMRRVMKVEEGRSVVRQRDVVRRD